MIERKLRLAVVGLGKMGLLHASLLNVFSEVELVALCEKSALMGRLFRKAFESSGVQVVNNLDKLSGLDLDAVYVTTPISSHSNIVGSLLSKGIARNVFVEKTLALNYIQAQELCSMARKVDGITMVGYMKRYSVVFRKAKEVLTNGNLGELKSFKAYAFSSDFLGLTKESKSSASRGGALRDIGCHIIDLSLWLLGELEVSEVLSIIKNEVGSETSISFTALGSDEIKGQFDISQSMPNFRMPEFGISIECTKGTIEVNDDRLCINYHKSNRQKWYRQDLNDTVYFSIGEAEYFRENREFVDSLLLGKKCEPNFDTSAKVDYLIDQVRVRSSQ